MPTSKRFLGNDGDFPTVLIAELGEPLRTNLSQSLRSEGINVLETDDWTGTFALIKSHSRPIHFLLTNVKEPITDLAQKLRPYVTGLQIILVAQHPSEIRPNVLHSDCALAKVRELLKL
jgi:hypothetical protein